MFENWHLKGEEMRFIAIVLLSVAALLTGCATSDSQKMNQVGLGMTKVQVVEVLGPPVSTSAKAGVEYLLYKLSDPGRQAATVNAALKGLAPTDPTASYFVRLIDGRVESYGRVGDFDSAQVPETKSTIELNIKK